MQDVTVSIVSHNHGLFLNALLSQLAEFSQHIAEVIIIHNIHDDVALLRFPSLKITEIYNKIPKGFGANHNQAFNYCHTKYFCVMNPDIGINSDPFSGLLSCFQEDNVALVSPVIVGLNGNIEDSARYFPTPFRLVKKFLGKDDGRYPMKQGQPLSYPDWVGGMFMVVDALKFKELTGFDESFFLYYEDVDLCTRVWCHGYSVVFCGDVIVTHDARRESHKNIKFLKWHLLSIVKYFIKHLGRFPQKDRN